MLIGEQYKPGDVRNGRRADGYRVDPQAGIPFRIYATVAEDGVVTITIDTDANDAPAHHDHQGCPYVRVLVNDGEVYNHSKDEAHQQPPVTPAL